MNRLQLDALVKAAGSVASDADMFAILEALRPLVKPNAETDGLDDEGRARIMLNQLRGLQNSFKKYADDQQWVVDYYDREKIEA